MKRVAHEHQWEQRGDEGPEDGGDELLIVCRVCRREPWQVERENELRHGHVVGTNPQACAVCDEFQRMYPVGL